MIIGQAGTPHSHLPDYVISTGNGRNSDSDEDDDDQQNGLPINRKNVITDRKSWAALHGKNVETPRNQSMLVPTQP